MADQRKAKSFTKTVKKSSNIISGTKSLPHNFTLVTSTGLSSVDSLLGGGLPLGSLLLIEEDEFSFYSELLAKYCVAEGIVNNHRLILTYQDGGVEKLLQHLPGLADSELLENKKPTLPDNQQMQIAWRYNNLKAADVSIGGTAIFGHKFDLTQNLPKDVVKAADITLLKDHDEKLCDSLSQILREPKHSNVDNSANLQVCRIALLGLGPPLWEPENIPKLLYCLRSYLRKSAAVAVVTVPSHLLQNKQDIEKFYHLADMCIKLESFAGTPRAINPALKDYHGLFHIKKLATFNSLAPHAVVTDLAFKLRRRRLIIERLCLPPELEDTAARGEEDAGVLTCGSGNSKKLDF